jgi:ABC-type sugar transport system ATPase subunit
MTASTPQVAKLVAITKYYGGVRALGDVSLELEPGTITCLVGDNGAGKSTLGKILGGLVAPDAGEIWIAGSRYERLTPRLARELGIETVPQNLALCDNLGATANVMLGGEPTSRGIGPFRLVDNQRARAEAERRIAEVGIHLDDLESPIRRLSGGQRQAVAIARAMVRGQRVVIFDEPTAALGVRQRHVTLELIGRVARQGVAALVISHNVEDVFLLGGHVVALRLGQVILYRPVSEVTRELVTDAMSGTLTLTTDAAATGAVG